MSCLFCRLVSGEVEASVVHRDELVVAVMDISPVNPGHVLVLPRQHYVAITDLPTAELVRMTQVAHALARAVRQAFPRTEGVNLMMSEGKAAAQSVPHSHLHVIPRISGDGLRLSASDRIARRPELDSAAAALREAATFAW